MKHILSLLLIFTLTETAYAQQASSPPKPVQEAVKSELGKATDATTVSLRSLSKAFKSLGETPSGTPRFSQECDRILELLKTLKENFEKERSARPNAVRTKEPLDGVIQTYLRGTQRIPTELAFNRTKEAVSALSSAKSGTTQFTEAHVNLADSIMSLTLEIFGEREAAER